MDQSDGRRATPCADYPSYIVGVQLCPIPRSTKYYSPAPRCPPPPLTRLQKQRFVQRIRHTALECYNTSRASVVQCGDWPSDIVGAQLRPIARILDVIHLSDPVPTHSTGMPPKAALYATDQAHGLELPHDTLCWLPFGHCRRATSPDPTEY